MGNKSKRKQESIATHWKAVRNVAGARLPPSTGRGGVWNGLQEKRINPVVTFVRSDGAREKAALGLPVIYASSKLGTLIGSIQRQGGKWVLRRQ